MNRKISAVILACGAACGVASAQPTVITGSGATLLENFFRSPASTNDFIDVDQNGTSGARNSLFAQQLAGSTISTSVWQLGYRITGSGNGIREFDLFSTIIERDIADVNLNIVSIANRANITSAGAVVGAGNPAHPGGLPFLADPTNGYAGSTIANAAAGFTVDFNSSDVPLAWFAIQSGERRPDAVPGSSGYGGNPRLAQNKNGTLTTQTNLLRPLTILNTNVTNPDAFTVYEFPIATVPVAAIVNYGVGLEQIKMSDLRHLAATGRRFNGENLIKVTRDSGSGTRNAFMNGIGLDPSFGRGENIGATNDAAMFNILGPNYLPTNKTASGGVESTVFNTRLGVGHTGPERGVSSGWLVNNQADVLAIRDDLRGGTRYTRPTRESTLGLDESGVPYVNAADGYTVLGPAGLSIRGNPRAAAPELGGWGWDPDGFFDGRGPDGVLGTADDETVMNNPFAGDPAPPNDGAAAYANNILRSLALFLEVPMAPENEFMPGERLSQQFVLNDAGVAVLTASPSALTDTQPVPLIDNPTLNPALLAFAASNAANFLANPLYDQFNSNRAGRVPTRTTGVMYSEAADGSPLANVSATGAHYVNQGGSIVAYNGTLNLRNKVAGDFNGDERRTPADVMGMMSSFRDRSGGPAWVAPAGSGPNNAGTPGTEAIIEVLGDFNADGNFNDADILYWADGLHLTTTAGTDWCDENGAAADLTHNRAEAFAAIDAAAATLGVQAPGMGGNGFFRIILGNTGATYGNGDGAADVAGGLASTPGFAPNGCDRRVDQEDIDYVAANFGDWTDLGTAVNIDLSCDMNGDLVVDMGDIDFVLNVLETVIGDFNLDGVRDGADRAIIVANQGGTGYANGDFDLDGDVDGDDLAAFPPQGCNVADLSPAFGTLDINDILVFAGAFNANDPIADFFPDGMFDINDILTFAGAFNAGCP